MAGLFSHLISGKSVTLNLNKEQQNLISKHQQAYYLGTQGPDLFYYYYTRIFYRSVRPLGQILHKEKVGKFLSELVYNTKHIKNTEQREVATAYLLGYLCHYVVDAYTHPYVYYHAGFSTNKKFKFSPLNSMYHRIIEDNIDHILLDYFHQNAQQHHSDLGKNLETPNKYKHLNKYFKLNKNDTKVISTLLKTAIHNSYDINIDSERIKTAINQMTLTLTILEAKATRKKQLVIFEDYVSFKDVDKRKLKEFQEKQTKKDYLNFEHNTWHAPWDLNIDSNADFYQLLHNAVDETALIFSDIENYLNNRITFNKLMDVVKNRSLLHGSDCVEDIAFKYHNIIFKKINIEY